MVNFLDMLDLVEGQIEVFKVRKVFETADMGDQIVVEVEILEGGG